jgi:hypothetical protein
MWLLDGSTVNNIFIKNKTVVLDCFTAQSSAYELFKIDYANKFTPKWLKNTPANFVIPNEFVGEVKVPTIKTCYGLVESYKKSFMLPLWSDLVVSTDNENMGYYFCDPNSKADFHDPRQTNGLFTEDYHHMKLLSPWHIRTKDRVNFFTTAPFWNSFDQKELFRDVIVAQGMSNFDAQRATNVNILFPRMQKRYEFLAGTPIMQFIPLTEKNIELKHHLVSLEEYKRIDEEAGVRCFFANKIKKYRSLYDSISR